MISAWRTHSLKRLRLVAVILSASIFLLFTLIIDTFAQGLPTLGGVAVNIEISDDEVQNGDIISATKDGFVRSTEAYDIQVFGVVVDAPILSVEPKTENTRPVLSSGEALVRVSNANGDIEENDLITTSENAGVGQKATASGYVIGKSLESYNESGPGLISVLISPSYGSGTGAGIGSLFGIAANPENARFVLAALLGMVIIIGGAYAFARLVSTGVGAVGRNPLAKGSIYRSMIIAGVVIVLLAIAGVGVIIAIINFGG